MNNDDIVIFTICSIKEAAETIEGFDLYDELGAYMQFCFKKANVPYEVFIFLCWVCEIDLTAFRKYLIE